MLMETLAQLSAQDRYGSPEDVTHQLGLHRRYLAARVPQKGEAARFGPLATVPVLGRLESVGKRNLLLDLARPQKGADG